MKTLSHEEIAAMVGRFIEAAKTAKQEFKDDFRPVACIVSSKADAPDSLMYIPMKDSRQKTKSLAMLKHAVEITGALGVVTVLDAYAREITNKEDGERVKTLTEKDDWSDVDQLEYDDIKSRSVERESLIVSFDSPTLPSYVLAVTYKFEGDKYVFENFPFDNGEARNTHFADWYSNRPKTTTTKQ